MNIKPEYEKFVDTFKSIEKKTVSIFLIIAILQTVSWYFTSRLFFRENLFSYFRKSPDVYLYEFAFWFIGDFIILFIIPLIIIKVYFKESPAEYGLQFGDKSAGLRFTIISVIISAPILWFVSGSSEFTSVYPMLASAKTNLTHLIILELLTAVYMISWEFIWRGFMQFGLEKKFGAYAIFMQMLPFVILHNGKPILETFGAVFGAVALGYLAFRTRSIYYGVIIHSAVMIMIDVFAVIRFNFGN